MVFVYLFLSVYLAVPLYLFLLLLVAPLSTGRHHPSPVLLCTSAFCQQKTTSIPCFTHSIISLFHSDLSLVLFSSLGHFSVPHSVSFYSLFISLISPFLPSFHYFSYNSFLFTFPFPRFHSYAVPSCPFLASVSLSRLFFSPFLPFCASFCCSKLRHSFKPFSLTQKSNINPIKKKR